MSEGITGNQGVLLIDLIIDPRRDLNAALRRDGRVGKRIDREGLRIERNGIDD